MLGCECHSKPGGTDDALAMFPQQLAASGNEGLTLFIRGVQVGLQIKAAEQAKWQRLGVMLALTFGALTFIKHFGEQ